MSILSDLNLKDVIDGSKIIVLGTVSAVSTYALTAFLAGRSIFKIGILIATGTNPALLALAAVAGTVAFVVFDGAGEKCKIKQTPSVLGSAAVAGTFIFHILSGNIVESLTVAAITALAHMIFMKTCMRQNNYAMKYFSI